MPPLDAIGPSGNIEKSQENKCGARVLCQYRTKVTLAAAHDHSAPSPIHTAALRGVQEVLYLLQLRTKASATRRFRFAFMADVTKKRQRIVHYSRNTKNEQRSQQPCHTAAAPDTTYDCLSLLSLGQPRSSPFVQQQPSEGTCLGVAPFAPCHEIRFVCERERGKSKKSKIHLIDQSQAPPVRKTSSCRHPSKIS